KTADLLLNVSLVNPLRDWMLDIPVRAAIDTDPAFTQIRHLTDAHAPARAAQHTVFFSFGENIAMRPMGQSSIPDDGFPWQPTRQPIVLDAWPVVDPPDTGRFTTVMQWDSYAAREHEGRRFGMKSTSFVPYLSLPGRVGPLFEIAVGGTTAAQVLGNHGWAVRNPIKAI